MSRYPIPLTSKPRYRKPSKRLSLVGSLLGNRRKDSNRQPSINLAAKLFPIKHSSHN
jgi:hypothetical protein